MDVPPFIRSCTSLPLTRKLLADSRCPLIDRLPGLSCPDGATAPVTPAMMIESACIVVTGITPG